MRIDGTLFPGWWAFHDPDPILPAPGGPANFGIAHGITGPLALLAQAMRRGIIVEDHIDSISGSGLYQTAWRDARDALTPAISTRLPHLAELLTRHAEAEDHHDAGLLDGGGNAE